MQKAISQIEFMFGGGQVRVEMLPKQVLVNFFGQRMDFTATKSALRERVREEIRKAGFMAHLNKITSRK